MIISFASGKGGTGKTTVATNLALSLNKSSISHFNGSVQFLDCDVEEPDSHIFLKPKISHTQPVSIPIPKVDENKCNLCGKCQKVCQFNAIVVLPKSSWFRPSPLCKEFTIFLPFLLKSLTISLPPFFNTRFISVRILSGLLMW
ncbi:hypothetical protein ES705_19982 [subsurface metagenome]